MSDILIQNLKKTFFLPQRSKNPWYKKAYHFLRPQYEAFHAVDSISFSIEKGEKVAFIGPNGAGKSTTMKMLTGILYPTDGTVSVLGKRPSKERKKLAKDIGVVFGHSSQLWSHLHVFQSFELLAAIYSLPHKDFKNKLNYLTSKFDVKHLLAKTVRKLSLGERMRCEILASLLHSPKILLLDEPTIGLDIIAKANLRDLIMELVQENESTLLLTSHDVSDIERICDRVIIIDRGKIVLDSPIQEMKEKHTKKTILSIVSDQMITDWHHPGTTVVEKTKHQLKLEIDLSKISKEHVINTILKTYSLKDISFENPSLETVIRNFYESCS